MKYEIFDVKAGDMSDSGKLYLYLLDDSSEIPIRKRPVIIICPGGGYGMTSDREAESIAMQYVAFGYHAAVLRYSVAPAVFPAALLELASAVTLIREYAAPWHVDPDRIVISGFSAGGHMAASYGVFWNKDWVSERSGKDKELLRPNAMILGYPVITAGKYAHHDSIRNLLGEEYEARKEEMSLESQVTAETPRTFIWHTYEDNVVPVQNSLLMVNALVKQGIPAEFHMFEKGLHGLSLANRLTLDCNGFGYEPGAAAWMGLVHQWLESWLGTV